MKENEKTVFDTLSAINVNEKTEKKNGLTYLSWAWAWGIVKKTYPSASYEVTLWDGKPYLFDEDLGYLVQTTVSIDGEKIGMQLPVMDGANKAQKNVPYTYKTKFADKTVEAATMFDINTAIMRCLTKNLAMFGLGHYIYAGEDLPEDDSKQPEPAKRIEPLKKTEPAQKIDPINGVDNDEIPEESLSLIKQLVKEATTFEDLNNIFKNWTGYQRNETFLNLLGNRKKELQHVN